MKSMGPLQRYQLDLQSEAISADDEQAALVSRLQELYEEIVRAQSGASWTTRLLQRFRGQNGQSGKIQGLYIWGGVGRGKTYLMDVFFDSLPGESKMRTHFHRFLA